MDILWCCLSHNPFVVKESNLHIVSVHKTMSSFCNFMKLCDPELNVSMKKDITEKELPYTITLDEILKYKLSC